MEPIRLKIHQINIMNITEVEAIYIALVANKYTSAAVKAISLARLNEKYDLSESEVKKLKLTFDDEMNRIKKSIQDMEVKMKGMEVKMKGLNDRIKSQEEKNRPTLRLKRDEINMDLICSEDWRRMLLVLKSSSEVSIKKLNKLNLKYDLTKDDVEILMSRDQLKKSKEQAAQKLYKEYSTPLVNKPLISISQLVVGICISALAKICRTSFIKA